jgi:uncharacterized membrane protein YdjX (TVP38/TMEM64 family)
MLQEILARIQSLPWLSGETSFFTFILYTGLVAVSQVVLLPISAFDIAAGFAFGFSKGFLVMMVAKTLSAGLNFHLARTVLRKPVERLAARFPLLEEIQAAVAQEGWKLAGLLRLLPIPFSVASYGFGLTRLPSLPHLFSTLLAVIPPTLMFSSVGASAKAGLSALSGTGTAAPKGPWSHVMLAVGILAAILITRRISKIATQALQNAKATRASSAATATSSQPLS